MTWRGALEAGDCSLAEAVAGAVLGVSAPADDAAPSFASRAFEADCAAAIAAGDAGLRAVLAGRALSFAEYQRLLAAGVDAVLLGNLNVAGDVGAARVDLSRDGTRFALRGPDPRLLVAVRGADFTVRDLVALASHDENQWSLLRGPGSCGVDMLGAWWLDDIDRALATGRPARLRLFATPWDWLRGGGAGVCVLDWNRGVLAHLRSLGERVTIEVADVAARSALRGRLERGGLPLVAAASRPAGQVATLAERIGMGIL